MTIPGGLAIHCSTNYVDVVLTDSSLSVSKLTTVAALSEMWRSVSSRQLGSATEIGAQTAVVTSVATNAEVTVFSVATLE